MREVKYRVWHKKLTHMYEVVHIDFINKLVGVHGAYYDTYYYPFKEVQLMEYLELKDNNDNQICEGDLVRVEDCNFDNYFYRIVRVENINTYWFAGSEILQHIIEDCTIVGNIFENPELEHYIYEEDELKTIDEWAESEGIKILDYDGFNRNDQHLLKRVITEEEYLKGAIHCTVLLGDKKDEDRK